jgi:glycosyltransferase involved in cell wall biosynthesis
MRILQVLHSHGYGGAEGHCLALMKGLRALGHEVLYAGPQQGWLTRACQEAGIPTEHLRMSGLYDLASHFKLHRLVKKWHPDIVHGHLVRGAYYAGYAARGGVRSVTTVHSTNAFKHMQRCHHRIAVCEAVRHNLLRHGHAASEVTTIYNGRPDVARRQASALRQALGIADGEFAVFSAGRFIRDKGQDLMVRAVQACTVPVTLWLAGDTDTPFGQEVLRLAQGDARVRFLGYRSDVQDILPAFNAYLSPSRREAFSLSLLEASAAALPIVASSVGGIPESIEHGRSGLLVDSEDVPALARALEQLARDATLCRTLGQGARERFLERFTEERMTRDTAALYERLRRGGSFEHSEFPLQPGAA